VPKSGVFFVTAELQNMLDNLPADEPRSRLEPFRAFILRWRREGRSYRRIQQILADQCGVRVATDTLHKFVQSRSRPRKAQSGAEIKQPPIALVEPDQTANSDKRLSPEERAAQVEFIRSLNKPELEDQPKPRWNFDADKPRIIHKP
jgi:hypothetical protein